MKPIKIMPVALSLSTLFSISYILCVIYGLLVPNGLQMYPVWAKLLPGFQWFTFGSFLLGLIETIIYGFYVAYIFIPVFNFFNVKLNRISK